MKLDDTATFLALTDRGLEHGRSLEGLAPSSYEATLAFNLPFYPLGSLLPLGIGASLVGQDTAWVFQPYVAFLAALLGLSLYRLAGLVLGSRPGRALAAVLAAQAALLYGYSLWGGVKEVAAAALVALAAALTSSAFGARRSTLGLLPLGIAAAALIGVLSIGAVVWLVPVGAVVASSVLRGRSGIRPLALAGAGVVLLIPSLVVARLILGQGVLSSVRDKAELGNLVAALSPLQLLGVWPTGDFRFRPERMDVTYALIAVLVAAAIGGLLVSAARRAWELPLYVAGTVGGAVLYRDRRVAVDRGQGIRRRLAGTRARRGSRRTDPLSRSAGRRCRRRRRDRARRGVVERPRLRRRHARSARATDRAGGDRQALRRPGAGAHDGVPALRRPALLAQP